MSIPAPLPFGGFITLISLISREPMCQIWPKISTIIVGSVSNLQLQLEGASLNSSWFLTQGASEETQSNSKALRVSWASLR